MSALNDNVVVTGMGIVSPIGIGISQFATALKEGKTNFSVIEFVQTDQTFKFPVSKVENFDFKELLAQLQCKPEVIHQAKRLRNISLSAQYAVYAALEAWDDAGLDNAEIDLSRVAIISSGNNIQQGFLQQVQDQYRDKLQFINPNYGLYFFDTDAIGILTELLEITGEGHSIGAASASGNMAIIDAIRLLKSNEYDVVLVVSPLMDLSIYEYQGLTALGAMAKLSEGIAPSELCRPFDKDHNGFVYGQSGGCIIVESEAHATKRGKQAYGALIGYGISMDANRNPNPSVEGEKKAMLKAIESANIQPENINYVNTHGTGSAIGDQTEVEALLSVGLKGVKANSTKSLIGHGLSAAGIVECIATLIQMNQNFLHISHNLVSPITDKIDWVKEETLYTSTDTDYAISNSLGFGGVNTAIIMRKIHYAFSQRGKLRSYE